MKLFSVIVDSIFWILTIVLFFTGHWMFGIVLFIGMICRLPRVLIMTVGLVYLFIGGAFDNK